MSTLSEAQRPRLGWPAYLMLLAAGACFPLAVYAGEWVDDSSGLVVLGLAGGVFGVWLADKHPRDRLIWPLGIVAGAMVTFVAVGQTLPSVSLLFQAYGSVVAVPPVPGYVGEVARFLEMLAAAGWVYFREVGVRSSAFATQIARWAQTVLAGGVSRDNDIFLLWTGWLSWVLGFHVAAAFTRIRHPGLALAPLGLAVTVAEAANVGSEDGWLYTLLGLGTLLWAFGTYLRSERRWTQESLDYSTEVRLDVMMAGFILAVVVTGTAFVVAWGIPWAGSVLRQPLAGPTQHVGATINRLFGGVRRPPQIETGWSRTDFPDLPLSHVLAGPPELRDDPVLRVTVATEDAAELPQLYWSGLTYDQYTGHGWANSSSETKQRPPRPEPITHLGPEISQHVKLLTDAGTLRYAAAQPVRVDVGATWITRDNEDLIGWYADAAEYTVVSQPTMASVEALRSAPSDYPAWVTERYLELPPELPDRVRQRAEEIVGEAGNAYDKASAIEAAMRAITYSLEVGTPPPDRDVVDYFLFDMDAGYCDYFATTMTVLARAVGVPARMATGYATGTYDPELGFYVVTGLDAHAWVEVYFPGIGWVPFEPTPARAVIDRSPPPVPQAGRSERVFGIDTGRVDLPWPLPALIVLVAAGGLGVWAVRYRRAGQLTPEDRVRAVYDAVWQQASRFGWDGNVSQTPWERVAALQHALAERSWEVGWRSRRLILHGADANEDLSRLGGLFVKAQYSREGVTAEEAQTAGDAWHRVRWRLPLLWRGITRG